MKLALLTGTMKLFFERPPEVHLMLGKLLLAATSDSTGESQDVRDKGLLYYRLIRHDIKAAQLVISESNQGSRKHLVCFAEDQEVQIKDALFNEFNSLSIIYSKLQRHFISADKRPYDANHQTPSSSSNKTSTDQGNNGEISSSSSNDVPTSSAVVSDVSAAIYGSPVDLLGNDLLSMDDTPSYQTPTQTPTPTPSNNMSSDMSQFSLKSNCDMSEAKFQELWQLWQPSEFKEEGLMLPGVSTIDGLNADLCFKHLMDAHVFTMASGDLPDTVKLFL